MSDNNFQKALERLVTESGYCEIVKNDPQRLISDHSLGADELEAMRDIAARVGWDVHSRDGDSGDDGDGGGGGVSCCCCCMQPQPNPNPPV